MACAKSEPMKANRDRARLGVRWWCRERAMRVLGACSAALLVGTGCTTAEDGTPVVLDWIVNGVGAAVQNLIEAGVLTLLV